MQTKLFFTGYLIVQSFILTAQFRPGDIGYVTSMAAPFAQMQVLSQVETKVDAWGWSTPYAQNTYNAQGMLIETLFLQDSSLSSEERSPDMIDVYNYHADGRIRLIEMFGYDLLPINIGFEYSKKGKLTASVVASAEAREYTYVLNKKDQVIQRNGQGAMWVYADEADTEGKLQMVPLDTTTYSWNAEGFLASETYRYLGEWQHRIEYTYTGAGQLSSFSMFTDNSAEAIPVFTIDYTYDANGLLMQATTTEGTDKFISNFTYTYR